jgi:hypothetical protein
MSEDSKSDHASRHLQTALDMHQFGVEMMEQRLIREIGEGNRALIESRLRDWLARQAALPERYFRVRKQ